MISTLHHYEQVHNHCEQISVIQRSLRTDFSNTKVATTIFRFLHEKIRKLFFLVRFLE